MITLPLLSKRAETNGARSLQRPREAAWIAISTAVRLVDGNLASLDPRATAARLRAVGPAGVCGVHTVDGAFVSVAGHLVRKSRAGGATEADDNEASIIEEAAEKP